MEPKYGEQLNEDLLLDRIGFEWLNNNGYIHLVDAHVEPNFADSRPYQYDPSDGRVQKKRSSKSKRTGSVVAVKTKSGSKWAATPAPPLQIHPLLAYECWQNLSREEWEAIRDSLMLVTRVLEDPAVMEWFLGLTGVDKYAHLPEGGTRWLRAHHGRNRLEASFKTRKPDDDEEMIKLWRSLREYMPRAIRWRFGSVRETGGNWGVTDADPTRVGLEVTDDDPPRNLVGATVTLRNEFLDAIMGRVKATDTFLSMPVHELDDDSAVLRSKYLLAILILHEFQHAYWRTLTTSYIPPLPPSGQKVQLYFIHEPYYRDQRRNELGHAFQGQFFAGFIAPTGPRHGACPFGLCHMRWPGGDHQLDVSQNWSERELGSARKWGMLWQSIYAIPMDYIQKIFSRKFWEQDVELYGTVKLLRPPKDIGIRLALQTGLYADETDSPAHKVDLDSSGSESSYGDDAATQAMGPLDKVILARGKHENLTLQDLGYETIE